MNRAEFLARLGGHEWHDFEVKAAQGGVPTDALRTICAFANSGRGWVVFGIAEQGGAYEVRGLADFDTFQGDLLTQCRDGQKWSRPVEVHPRHVEVEGLDVLALRVEEAPRVTKPVQVRLKGTWQAYVRVGATDHLCSPDELAGFTRDAAQERFDQTPCPELGLEDLDEDSGRWLWQHVAAQAESGTDLGGSWQEWLSLAALARPDGSLTHAAALLLGGAPVLARLCPGGVVDFRLVRGPSTEGTPEQRWDDRRLLEENLVRTLRALFERLNSLLPQTFELEDDGPLRRPRSRDEEALREAVVNLLAHQDYEDRTRTAQILWWDDQVTLRNPGDSFVAPEDLVTGGFSELRNPLIGRVLRQAGLAEQAGTGVPAILRTWREAGRPSPRLVSDAGRKEFRLVLEWGAAPSPPPAGLDEREQELLALLAEEPGLRVPAITERLEVSTATVERALKVLRDRGLVRFHGAPKTGGYYLEPLSEGEGVPEGV